MKKKYIEPNAEVIVMRTQGFLAASKLLPDTTPQSITPTEDEFTGEFSAPSVDGFDDF